jgi:hypothetical protein
MKRKILISFFIILLILALTGCVVAPELTTNRFLAEEAVYNYWQAIINRQYELAKCYCIIGGIWDNKVDEWEEYINTNSEGEASSLMIYSDKFYKPTEIIGDNAVVYARIITDKIVFPTKKLVVKDIMVFTISQNIGVNKNRQLFSCGCDRG